MAHIFDESKYPISFWNRIKSKDKYLFYEHIGNLTEGGVSILQALDSFIEKTDNPLMRRQVALLKFFIDSGDGFATGMKKIPQTFSKMETALIESGEGSGMLQRSFAYLGKHFRDAEEIRGKIVQAFTTPVIVFLFLILALGIILTYVIPKIVPLFQSSGVEMPFATRMLIGFSDFVATHTIGLIILAVTIVAGLYLFAQTPSGKQTKDLIMMRLPLVGPVFRNYLVVRMVANLGMLLESGIPVLKTLHLTAESTNHTYYEDAINQVAQKIAQGKKMVESMEEVDPSHTFFPKDFLQMLAAGERTSTVNKVCQKIVLVYEREVDHAIASMIKWIEPLAILFAGIFVFWFAFALFSAVVKITETVS